MSLRRQIIILIEACVVCRKILDGETIAGINRYLKEGCQYATVDKYIRELKVLSVIPAAAYKSKGIRKHKKIIQENLIALNDFIFDLDALSDAFREKIKAPPIKETCIHPIQSIQDGKCLVCDELIFDVEPRACGECRHFRDDTKIHNNPMIAPQCTRFVKSKKHDDHATFLVREGTCWEPKEKPP